MAIENAWVFTNNSPAPQLGDVIFLACIIKVSPNFSSFCQIPLCYALAFCGFCSKSSWKFMGFHWKRSSDRTHNVLLLDAVIWAWINILQWLPKLFVYFPCPTLDILLAFCSKLGNLWGFHWKWPPAPCPMIWWCDLSWHKVSPMSSQAFL